MPNFVEQFHDSLQRCQADSGFFSRFYQTFFNADSSVPNLFAGIEMRKQELMLQASLYIVMLASQSNNAAELYLEKVAAKHRVRHIPDYLFDVWLECLLKTVASSDPRYNKDIEAAWRHVMNCGVAYMKAHAAAK